jgi:glucan phosphoethanolaminetransferase (alkaline phosphatase superfamily)
MKTKKNNKNLYLSSPVYVLLFSIFLVLFYALPSIILKFSTNIVSGFSAFHTIVVIISELLLAIIITTIFLWLFSFSRILLKIVAIIFIVSSTIFSWYVLVNHVGVDEFFIATIFETPLHDAGNAINFKVFIWFFLLGLIPLYFWIFKVKIRYYGNTFFSKIVKYLLSLVGVVVILVGFLLSSYLLNKEMYTAEHSQRVIKASLSVYMPLNYVAGF